MKVALAAVSCLLAPTLWAAPPTDLTTDSICRDRLTARWTNAAGVVSNALEVIKVFPNAFEADYATNYTFDAISNSGNRARILSEADFLESAPDFCGERVYAAAESVGLLQLGAGKETGRLEFKGLDSYDGLSLVIYMQSTGRVQKAEMPIEWSLDKQSQTNGMTTIAVASSMDCYEVALTNVANGARLVFHSFPKGDPRVLIDSIGFAYDATFPPSPTDKARPFVIRVR